MRRFSMIFLLLTVACEAPSIDSLHQIDLTVESDSNTTNDKLIDLIDGATESLVVALPSGEDERLGLALVAAADAGVTVEVIADIDEKGTAAFDLLKSSNVDIHYADDGIGYFDFALNEDLAWDSTQIQMSHAFAIADHTNALFATRAGHLDDTAPQVSFAVKGEDLIDDLWIEFNQIAGGTDAAALTYYSGPAKSVADLRWLYPTQTEASLEVWFGPQERLIKRIIDATYGARANIYIMTNNFTDAGLATALQAKAETAFDVKVVVGPEFGADGDPQSDILKFETPDVSKRQAMSGDLPTVVLVDTIEGRDGRQHTSRAFVLSHDLYSATRVYELAETTTDQYIDGSLWVINDFQSSSEEVATLYALFDQTFTDGGAL